MIINGIGQPLFGYVESCYQSKGKDSPSLPEVFFGKEEWEKQYGDIGYIPPLPENIDAILNTPCPFTQGKTVRETHVLFLVPSQINTKPVNLGNLNSSFDRTSKGRAFTWIARGLSSECTEPVEKSCWVLMTQTEAKRVSIGDIDTGRSKVLSWLSDKSYRLPMKLEVFICMNAQYSSLNASSYDDETILCFNSPHRKSVLTSFRGSFKSRLKPSTSHPNFDKNTLHTIAAVREL